MCHWPHSFAVLTLAIDEGPLGARVTAASLCASGATSNVAALPAGRETTAFATPLRPAAVEHPRRAERLRTLLKRRKPEVLSTRAAVVQPDMVVESRRKKRNQLSLSRAAVSRAAGKPPT